jgi:hypothetical protein
MERFAFAFHSTIPSQFINIRIHGKYLLIIALVIYFQVLELTVALLHLFLSRTQYFIPIRDTEFYSLLN